MHRMNPQLPPNVLVLSAHSDFQPMRDEIGMCSCWLHTSGCIIHSIQYDFSQLQAIAILRYGGYKSESQYLSKKFDYDSRPSHAWYPEYTTFHWTQSHLETSESPQQRRHMSPLSVPRVEAPKFAAFCPTSFDGPWTLQAAELQRSCSTTQAGKRHRLAVPAAWLKHTGKQAEMIPAVCTRFGTGVYWVHPIKAQFSNQRYSIINIIYVIYIYIYYYIYILYII